MDCDRYFQQFNIEIYIDWLVASKLVMQSIDCRTNIATSSSIMTSMRIWLIVSSTVFIYCKDHHKVTLSI